MKSKTIVVLSMVVMITMACSLSTFIGGSPTGQAPGGVSEGGGNDISSPVPVSIDPVPVDINSGLASLNSYEMTFKISSFGPDPAQSSTTSIKRQRSNDSNASLTSIDMVVMSPDSGESENTNTMIYQIGNDQCSGSDVDGWSWTSSTPAEAEMQGLIINMIGLTPLIDNPVFVAAETVNGISTNHFSFQVSGLGVNSGALVNINQGDYWLAVDGQYIVKYVLIVETSMAANNQVIHEEISIEMTQINQPVNIAFPQGCLEASLITPEP